MRLISQYCRDRRLSHVKKRGKDLILLWISPILLQAGRGRKTHLQMTILGSYRTGIITVLVLSELDDNMHTTVINTVHNYVTGSFIRAILLNKLAFQPCL